MDDRLAGAGPTTAVYMCGPTAMLEAVRVARDEHSDAPLHYERFSPPPVVGGVPFELELARSRRVLNVPANRSALDVMLDRDPTTPYSCQQGFCGTCKVKVLAGQVDHRGRTAVGNDEMWSACRGRTAAGSSSTPESVADVGHFHPGKRLPVHRAAVDVEVVLLIEAARLAVLFGAPQDHITGRM